MLSILQLKVVGIIIAAAGLIILLSGIIFWSKQIMAMGLVACLISVSILYYSWRLKPPRELETGDMKIN